MISSGEAFAVILGIALALSIAFAIVLFEMKRRYDRDRSAWRKHSSDMQSKWIKRCRDLELRELQLSDTNGN